MPNSLGTPTAPEPAKPTAAAHGWERISGGMAPPTRTGSPAPDAIFGGPNTAGGAVTLASPTTVGSITFNTFTGTYTLGTAGPGAHDQRRHHQQLGHRSGFPYGQPYHSRSQPDLDQQFLRGHARPQRRGSIASNTLTIDGSGGASFDTTANIISGTGGLTKNGTGRLILGSGGSVPTHTYTGTTTLNGGVTMVSNYNSVPAT